MHIDHPNQPFGVLWDMDGVLVDSGGLHFQSWKVALSEVGFSLDYAKFRSTFGMNNHGVLTLLFGHPPESEFMKRISERKEVLFRQWIHGQVQPLPGVLTWLETLQEHGFLQALASSAPQANIDALIDEMGIRSYFTALVSAAHMPSKPDPAVFLEAARRLSLPKNRCLVIEDSLAGVEAARRAGMKVLAVTTTNEAAALSGANRVVVNLACCSPLTVVPDMLAD